MCIISCIYSAGTINVIVITLYVIRLFQTTKLSVSRYASYTRVTFLMTFVIQHISYTLYVTLNTYMHGVVLYYVPNEIEMHISICVIVIVIWFINSIFLTKV